MKHIILASGSPRRKELFNLLSVPFSIYLSEMEERLENWDDSYAAAMGLALQKASEVYRHFEDAIVIGADTIVTYESQLLGKPKNKQDAEKMLRFLSGHTHEVVTGVAIISKDKKISFYEKTEVTFYSLTDAEIESYLDTDEPYDKAGSYGIQGKGALFVKEIKGDYYSVVGLPIARVARELKTFL
ncbi:Maf family protein [Ectobacillus sp. sgz5001026]|uniref:Maf family protein n=1 Tax=Ectobacillus sp. sgz5001026 TaxID=3242473 RepID=UPI0036D3D55B